MPRDRNILYTSLILIHPTKRQLKDKTKSSLFQKRHGEVFKLISIMVLGLKDNEVTVQ